MREIRTESFDRSTLEVALTTTSQGFAFFAVWVGVGVIDRRFRAWSSFKRGAIHSPSLSGVVDGVPPLMDGAAAAALRRPSILLLQILPLLSLLFSGCNASEGDRHPHFRLCANNCEKTGYINQVPIPSCDALDINVNPDFKQLQKLALLQIFDDWDCQSECRYQCMKDTESKREADREAPMKYYGKWPFTRYLNLQEPASVIFSLLNLFAHLHGLVSYYRLLHYNLPQPPLAKGGKTHYYEYTGMWMIYAVFAINSWIWSALFHARDVTITERLDYCSAVALLGFTLILTIIRVGCFTNEALKVMVSAPIIAFISTHIMYLNFYNFDYGLNMKVCITIGIAQLLLWTGWAGITHHPSRFKLWFVALATVLSVLLEIFDFPPFWGILDAHALWHACTIPITILWWDFISEDVTLRTFLLLRLIDSDDRKVQ